MTISGAKCPGGSLLAPVTRNESGSNPEMPALPLTVATVTNLWFGGQRLQLPGTGSPVIVGSVASRFIVTDWELDRPAPLVVEQDRVSPAVSVLIAVETQAGDAMPDSGSVADQLTATLLVYQPLSPKVPVIVGVITGAVWSILMVADAEFDNPAPFVAEHVRVVPSVFVMRLAAPHPVVDAIPDSGSTTDQETVTLLVYQPLVPSVPVTVGWMTGEVVSAEPRMSTQTSLTPKIMSRLFVESIAPPYSRESRGDGGVPVGNSWVQAVAPIPLAASSFHVVVSKNPP